MADLTLLERTPPRRLDDDVLRVAAAACRAPVDLVDLACQMVLAGGPPRGWQRDAACAHLDPDEFFLKRGQLAEPAKAVCRRCDVQAECLAASLLANDKHGVWGGLAERQRRSLRQILAKQGIMGVVGEERHLVWAEPGADVEPRPMSARRRVRLVARLDQKDAVRRIVEAFQTSDAAQIAMATGTGKTVVGVWTAEALRAETVVILVPSRQLIAQTARVWEDHLEAPSRMVAVCGDAGELDMPVTTSPEELRDQAKLARAAGERLVVVCTYHSSPVLVEAAVMFDLAIADEAHHLVGLAAKAFAAVVRGEVPARRRLYMTATPRTAVRAHADLEVRHMDHPVFGPRCFELGLDEAIKSGLIADYRVVVAAVDAETFEYVSSLLGSGVDPNLLAGAIGSRTCRRALPCCRAS